MKKTLWMLTVVILAACGSKKPEPVEEEKVPATILVAYFSATGHTRDIAQEIADVLEADLLEIEPEERYDVFDLNWHDEESRSAKERDGRLPNPPVKGKIENPDQYEIIYLGTPIWWHSIPPAVYSFLDNNDLSGKEVVIFSTSNGNTTEQAEEDLKARYPKVNWHQGKLMNDFEGKESQQAAREIKAWHRKNIK